MMNYQKIMMMPNNNSNLDIRLLNDFPITNKKSKYKKHYQKKKKVKKNSSN